MSCSKALRDNLAPCHLRRALGHAGEAFRLEVVLPGAVQVRQQALWHWLRRSGSARAFFAGHAPAADVVLVKDALHAALAPMLAAGMGKALREGLFLAPEHVLLLDAIPVEETMQSQQRLILAVSQKRLRDQLLLSSHAVLCRGLPPMAEIQGHVILLGLVHLLATSCQLHSMKISASDGLLMQTQIFVSACCLCIRRQPQRLTSCLGSSLGAGGRRGRRGSSP